MTTASSPSTSTLQLLPLFSTPTTLTPEDSLLVDRARHVVSNDPSLTPEIRDRVNSVLIGGSPNPVQTAQAVLDSFNDGGSLGGFLLDLRKGVDFFRNAGGGRRRSSIQAQENDTASSPASPAHSTATRSSQFTKLLQRSGERRCEITSGCKTKIQSCHIFPFSIGTGNPSQHHLWKLLRCFWSPETVAAVETTLKSGANINSLSNGICMTADAHTFFDQLDFYLEPDYETIAPSGKSYTVTFNWTRGEKELPNRWIQPILGPAGRRFTPDLATGDQIRFETINPETHPLPDPVLLSLRAIIARISHPKAEGAKEQCWDFETDDGDKDDAVFAESESESESLSNHSSAISTTDDGKQLQAPAAAVVRRQMKYSGDCRRDWILDWQDQVARLSTC